MHKNIIKQIKTTEKSHTFTAHVGHLNFSLLKASNAKFFYVNNDESFFAYILFDRQNQQTYVKDILRRFLQLQTERKEYALINTFNQCQESQWKLKFQ